LVLRAGNPGIGVAPDVGQIAQLEAARRKGFGSFPQVIASVWKVDAGNVKKIQDIGVSC
jgi:hypothetical protein